MTANQGALMCPVLLLATWHRIHAEAALPGTQFKIEPFKHPLKVDPLYGGKQSQLA